MVRSYSHQGHRLVSLVDLLIILPIPNLGPVSEYVGINVNTVVQIRIILSVYDFVIRMSTKEYVKVYIH